MSTIWRFDLIFSPFFTIFLSSRFSSISTHLNVCNEEPQRQSGKQRRQCVNDDLVYRLANMNASCRRRQNIKFVSYARSTVDFILLQHCLLYFSVRHSCTDTDTFSRRFIVFYSQHKSPLGTCKFSCEIIERLNKTSEQKKKRRKYQNAQYDSCQNVFTRKAKRDGQRSIRSMHDSNELNKEHEVAFIAHDKKGKEIDKIQRKKCN